MVSRVTRAASVLVAVIAFTSAVLLPDAAASAHGAVPAASTGSEWARFYVTWPAAPKSGEKAAFEGHVLPQATGTVQFGIDGTPLRTPRVVDGVAHTVVPLPVPIGRHTLTATYSGDARFAPATISTVVTVTRARPKIVLTGGAFRAGTRPRVTVTLSYDSPTIIPSGHIAIYEYKTLRRLALVTVHGSRTVTLPKLSKSIHIGARVIGAGMAGGGAHPLLLRAR